MHKIYNDFFEISDNFDTLLVDAYGVFWEGSRFYEGSLEMLAEMVKQKKEVCVLSNMAGTSDGAMLSYEKKGLIRGIHYTGFITSGDIAKKEIAAKNLDIPDGPVYMWGLPNEKLFTDSLYRITYNVNTAKSFYISIPLLTNEEKERYPDLSQEFYLSRFPKEDDVNIWDVMIPDPYIPRLKTFLEKGMIGINANPDFRAFETPKNGGKPKPVVRQGLIAKLYRDMGGKVIEFGKPYANIYKFSFDLLDLKPSKKIAMIGDTYRTDIKGALDSAISPVLCVETGMTKYETEQGKTLEDICEGNLDKIYLIKRLGRAVY